MNKNEYRRALIMLRSLRTGVSGYVRLERRTLIGTLHFTINGVQDGSSLYAVLLYRQGGSWHGVRAGELAATRYGQTGLVWKFDPRNIENRALEQYDLAAVIEIRSGICDLVLCGNLNGSVDVDWAEIREASCRVFTPVRIAGSPVSPIEEEEQPSPASDAPDSHVSEASDSCILSEEPSSSEDLALQSVQREPASEVPVNLSGDMDLDLFDMPAKEQSTDPDDIDTPAGIEYTLSETIESDETDTPAYPQEPQAVSYADTEPDDIDTPARADISSLTPTANDSSYTETVFETDELDTPALETAQSVQPVSDTQPGSSSPSAGDQLDLKDKEAAWPACIAPLKRLFFSSKAVIPFEAEGYIFIRAPLPEDAGADNCFVGLYCEDGIPARVCYALPSKYSPEPPAGLEGYVWRGDSANGCWTICEAVTPD